MLPTRQRGVARGARGPDTHDVSATVGTQEERETSWTTTMSTGTAAAATHVADPDPWTSTGTAAAERGEIMERETTCACEQPNEGLTRLVDVLMTMGVDFELHQHAA